MSVCLATLFSAVWCDGMIACVLRTSTSFCPVMSWQVMSCFSSLIAYCLLRWHDGTCYEDIHVILSSHVMSCDVRSGHVMLFLSYCLLSASMTWWIVFTGVSPSSRRQIFPSAFLSTKLQIFFSCRWRRMGFSMGWPMSSDAIASLLYWVILCFTMRLDTDCLISCYAMRHTQIALFQ